MLLGSSLCAQAAPLTERVSVRSDEGQANGLSIGAYVSATGRYILFESDATNLVAGDTNGRRDVFLRDRQLGTTTQSAPAARVVRAMARAVPGASQEMAGSSCSTVRRRI